MTHGKPESRGGRPAACRDPVVAVRLPHEAIADVDRLARTLGLSSRSDAIRHLIMRSTALRRYFQRPAVKAKHRARMLAWQLAHK